MVRSKFFGRSALGLVLALGVVAGASVSTTAYAKEKAPVVAKPQPSKGFIPPYQAAAAALDKASKNADITAAQTEVRNAETAYRNARGKDAKAQTKASLDAATAALNGKLSGELGLIEAAFAAVSNPDDKLLAGQLALNLGQTSLDKGLQRRGLQAMVDSGKLPPADMGKFNFYIGGISFDMKDFAAARTAFSAAIAGGYGENDIDYLLAEANLSDNLIPEGMRLLQVAIDKKGAAAPEDWLRRGMVVAYKSKSTDYSNTFGTRLVSLYPSTENWSLVIAVLRDLANFQSQESIDLLRLMERTRSFSEARDYVEYIQAADPRRLPGEVIKILDEGVAAGKLDPKDVFVSDARANSAGRIAPDKASFPALEKDARAANGTAATAMAAGDTFLSYDMPAKAIEMYQLALTRPGVDAPRVLTRLGIAQADAGQLAEAQATFAKVDGPRKPIAALWSVYAANKAAGK